MATFDASGAFVAVNMLNANDVNQASYLGGAWVRLLGDDERVRDHRLQHARRHQRPGGRHGARGRGLRYGDNTIYTVGGMVGDLAAMGTLEGYWRAILQGETTLLAPTLVGFTGAGDFITVGIFESLIGADDVFEGSTSLTASQTFAGDAASVFVGTLTGGNDTITSHAPGALIGDATEMLGGQVNGGNDNLLLDAQVNDGANATNTSSSVMCSSSTAGLCSGATTRSRCATSSI